VAPDRSTHHDDFKECTMSKAEDNLMDWLRDAHAMEVQAEKMLSSTASRIENYPDFKAGLERHAQETRQQIDRLKTCIERRGGDTSTVKDLAGRFAGTMQAMSGNFTSDEVVKAVLACYTFTHGAIASYRSLAAAADVVGDAQTKQAAESFLPQEEAMARWYGEQVPQVTRQFLQRADASGTTAKH
jgi:ferritin-like metal-binding protein YciE